MIKYKVIVGPDKMYVVRNGIKSKEADLTNEHGPSDVREIAAGLWESIKPLVSWLVWLGHRNKMAWQRKMVALVKASEFKGPYYAGPTPNLISVVPWKHTQYGQWTILPHGVVARLLREQKGN